MGRPSGRPLPTLAPPCSRTGPPTAASRRRSTGCAGPSPRRSAVLVLFALLNVTGVVGGDGGEEAAPTTTSETTTTTIPPLPACTEADVVVPDNPATEWATVLIDTARALPAGLRPGRPPQHRRRRASPSPTAWPSAQLVLDDLGALREAAAANGTPLSIIAAYRSYERQADLYERRVDELGDSEAGSRVARPGHSEHQLGTTIDVTTEGEADVDQSWGATPDRPVGGHQRPRVRLPHQLPPRCLRAHLLRLRALAPPLRGPRPRRRR